MRPFDHFTPEARLVRVSANVLPNWAHAQQVLIRHGEWERVLWFDPPKTMRQLRAFADEHADRLMYRPVRRQPCECPLPGSYRQPKPKRKSP